MLKTRGPTLQFFALTFAVTWIGSAIALNGDFGTAGSPLLILRTLLLLAGTFAPSLVAIVLTTREEGGRGTRALLGRLLDAQVAVRWYLFALGFMASIYFGFAVLARLAAGPWLFLSREVSYGMVTAMAIALPVQAGEEIGWRGYALPRLAARFGFARASLILGLIWASWHLPLFFIPAAQVYGQSFPAFVLTVVATSTAMTWLYVNTNGSLLLATLMHWAINQTGRIMPPPASPPGNPFDWTRSPIEWTFIGLMWMTAAYFLVKLHRVDLRSDDHGRIEDSIEQPHQP